jgi:hypothetical protein
VPLPNDEAALAEDEDPLEEAASDLKEVWGAQPDEEEQA